jgi:hypothetical protein
MSLAFVITSLTELTEALLSHAMPANYSDTKQLLGQAKNGRAVYVRALSNRGVWHGILDSTIKIESRRMVEHHLRDPVRRRNPFPLVRDSMAGGKIARSTIAKKAIRHPQKGA